MKVVTIAGCNLPASLLEAYGIAVVPQYMIVDGSRHDTRPGIPLAQVQRWIEEASTHPHVLRGTVPEFTQVYREVVARDARALMVIMTSPLIIGSYEASQEAARVVVGGASRPDLRIDVIDSNSLDLGSGLVTLYAALLAREADLLPRSVALVQAFVAQGRSYMYTRTVDFLLLGGHIGGRAFADNLIALNPVLSPQGGQMQVVDRLKAGELPETRLVERAVADIGEGRSVWCAISHGREPEVAARVAAALRLRFDVRFLLVRELQSSIWLNVGDGALGLFVFPVDALDWTPAQAPSAAS